MAYIELVHNGRAWHDFPWEWRIVGGNGWVGGGYAATRWGAIYAARREWKQHIKQQARAPLPPEYIQL